MSVSINYKNLSTGKNFSELIFFVDENYNLNGIKKIINCKDHKLIFYLKIQRFIKKYSQFFS